MKKVNEEKSLKRYYKRKLNLTLGVIVSFLITGELGHAEDTSGTSASIITTTTGTTTDKVKTAEGSEDDDAVNLKQLNDTVGKAKTELNTKIDQAKPHYIGVNSTATGAGTNYNNDGAIGTDAIAIGKDANAKGNSSIVLGPSAKTDNKSSFSVALASSSSVENSHMGVAIGYGSATKNSEGGVSLGWGTKTTDSKYGVAMGTYSEATGGNYGVAIGAISKANGEGATAIGLQSNANSAASVALGFKNKLNSSFSIGIGALNEVSDKSEKGIGIGTLNQILGKSEKTILIGANNKVTDSVLSIVNGHQNEVENSKQSITMGPGAKTKDSENAIVLGALAKATNSSSGIIIGSQANAKSNYVTAIGQNATIDENAPSSIAIGQRSYVGKETNTAPPVNPGDKDLNNRKTIANVYEDSMNPLDKEKYEFATAIGFTANAYGFQNTALGTGTNAHDTNTTAVGFGATARGDFSSALGTGAKTNAMFSIASGYGSKTNGERSVSIGRLAVANKKDSVALGSGSHADIDKGVFGYDPKDELTDLTSYLTTNDKTKYDTLMGEIATLKNNETTKSQELVDLYKSRNGVDTTALETIKTNIKTKENELSALRIEISTKQAEANKLVSTWQSTAAGISVGNAATGLTRQINNVAAGIKDTDAVNVAQLKRVATMPINFYNGGTVNNNSIENANPMKSVPLNELAFSFGDGIKAESKTIDGKGVVRIGLDKDAIKNDPTLKGADGKDGAAGKSAFDLWKEQDLGKRENATVAEFLASLKGEKGQDGAAGANGADGKSAYDVWKESPAISSKPDSEKTLDKYLEAIKGEKGETGVQGQQGNQGPKGDKGDPGLSAKDQWLKDNPGKTQDDYIASLKGKDGKDGKDGKSAYEVWKDSNPANAGKTEKDFIDSIGSGGKGGKDTEAPTIYITKDDKGNVYKVYRDGNKYYTTVNGKTVEVKGANVSVSLNNVVDKNGKIIPTTLTNVADGKAPNDAVNVSQLDRATQRLGREISDVREESRGIGALSASLAALHPMQYSKERPNQVMAGVGTYKNKQAVAVGVSHHFTENLMATAGVSLSGEHNTRTMANVGITWRIGKGDTEEVRNENIAIENAELKANVEKLNDKIELLERQIKLLIENSAK